MRLIREKSTNGQKHRKRMQAGNDMKREGEAQLQSSHTIQLGPDFGVTQPQLSPQLVVRDLLMAG